MNIHHRCFRSFVIIFAISLLCGFLLVFTQVASATRTASPAYYVLTPTPFFHYPVVANAPISGKFDHQGYFTPDYLVIFHDQRMSYSSSSGYWFSCPELGVSDWIGCTQNAAGEPNCPNSEELWYDVHTGTDFEYIDNWHTGDTCDRSQFAGITRSLYAPAGGKVIVKTSNQYNGNYIVILHDLDNNGEDPGDLRTFYLHFSSISVNLNQTVVEGQYLGLGGMTGKAYTPHLHFEVQRRYDLDVWVPVDPYGWTESDILPDPWPYDNYSLWKYSLYLPSVMR